MAAATLLAAAARLARVRDLGARDGADVDALAVGPVRLEARGALPVGLQRRVQLVVDAVARVGAHEHGLPDDIVRRLALLAHAQRRVERAARGRAEEGWLGRGEQARG